MGWRNKFIKLILSFSFSCAFQFLIVRRSVFFLGFYILLWILSAFAVHRCFLTLFLLECAIAISFFSAIDETHSAKAKCNILYLCGSPRPNCCWFWVFCCVPPEILHRLAWCCAAVCCCCWDMWPFWLGDIPEIKKICY